MARRSKGKTSPEEFVLKMAFPVGAAFTWLVLYHPGMPFQAVLIRASISTIVVAVAGIVGIRLLKSSREQKQASPVPSASRSAKPASPKDQSSTSSSSMARTFSEDVLRKLDWLAFEHLVLELFQHLGFQARKTGAGADGGVDIELHDPKAAPGASLKALIQCKARGTASVGVDKARELFGVMAARKVSRGVLVCNTWFTPDAVSFAGANPNLQLADLPWMLKQLGKVPEDVRVRWEKQFLGPDFDVPSCPACEIKLVRRTGKQGDFWGCQNYPRGCRSKISMRSEAKSDSGIRG